MEKPIVYVLIAVSFIFATTPLLQQLRARARLHAFYSRDGFDKTVLRSKGQFRSGVKGVPGKNHNPINVWNMFDGTLRIVSPTANKDSFGTVDRIQLQIGPPRSIFSSRPTWKIHRVVDEGNVSVNQARKEWEDFLASYIVQEYGFSEPERTTEIYTKSEHAAQTKLANGYLQANYVDQHGNEQSLERFLAPGKAFPEDRRPYDPNDDPSGEKIR
jgi:hypothetical protein